MGAVFHRRVSNRNTTIHGGGGMSIYKSTLEAG